MPRALKPGQRSSWSPAHLTIGCYALTRAGQTVTRGYDALHRVASKTGDPTVTYGWDYVGRLLQAATAVVPGDPSTGTWPIAYDSAGRRTRDAAPDGTVVGYGWDAAGNRTSLTYPDGKVVQTGYDALDRPDGLDWVGHETLVTDTIDPLGRLAGRTLAEPGFGTTYHYAGADTLVTWISHTYGSGGADDVYTWNKARQAASEAQSGTRLIVRGGAVAGYAIDTSDRIATQTPAGKGPIAFLYDANGDLTSDGVRTYTYDQEGDGHVLSAAASGMTASYRYDAFGRRYSKIVNGTATVFVHDDRGDVVAEHDGAGHVERDYAYLPHDPGPVVSLEAAGNVDFRQVDRLGSLMALSGGPPGTGTLLANWYAQPDYGVTRFFTAGVAFGYAGYYFDQETGLYHTRTRYYDPRLGRFLTPDPIRG
jgi:YD repeat-containing protein